MKRRMNLNRVVKTIVLSVFVSVTISYTFYVVYDPAMFDHLPAVVLPIVVPICVSAPVSYVWQRMSSQIEDQAKDLARVNAELAAAKAHADLANRRKTQFLASMSHELRTPLNSIIGFSDVISHQSMGPIGNDRYAEYASLINRSGLHLHALINDLIDLTKIESSDHAFEISEIDAVVCVRQAVEFARGEADAFDGTLSFEWDEKSLSCLGNERAVTQILTNLISYAMKYGGINPHVIVRASGTVRTVDLMVADNGPGMSDSEIDEALQAYGRIKHNADTRTGSGLGLYLVKQIAQAIGGSFRIESDLGGGTTATLTLQKAATNN